MNEVSTSQARREFARIIERAHDGERIVLMSHGKAVAALMPIEDLELLEEIEDRIDGRAADAALAEAREHGTIPWALVKAELAADRAAEAEAEARTGR